MRKVSGYTKAEIDRLKLIHRIYLQGIVTAEFFLAEINQAMDARQKRMDAVAQEILASVDLEQHDRKLSNF